MSENPNVRVVDGVLMASAMSIVHCEHGMIYFRLHDANGDVFAAGAMPAANAIRAAEELTQHIEAALKGEADSAAPHGCAGHA